MITPGHYYKLPVIRATAKGFQLDAGTLGDVLLPGKEAPAGLRVGDAPEVFLYLDSADQPLATTAKPRACVGEFAFLKVVATSRLGAFLDWGLPKDVLVPFAEQHRPMEPGHSYLVYLYLDRIDGRITASSKIDKFLDDDKPHTFKAQQAVDLIIANSTDLGYKAIIDQSHWGVLHNSDVPRRLSFGQSIKGFIKRVRPDGKIDLSLQATREIRNQHCNRIEHYLKENGAYAPVHDKSDPTLIDQLFDMSKAAFKKAIGTLYKEKIIIIEEDGIRLLAADSSPIRVVDVTTEPLELYKILKFEGLVDSGGAAKAAIADALVQVNGRVETQKRKKIVSGDIIEFEGQKIQIQRVSTIPAAPLPAAAAGPAPQPAGASAPKSSRRAGIAVTSRARTRPEPASRPTTGPWSGSGNKKSAGRRKFHDK
ncbi:MAG: S1-like domain-containing RNA-binding protein [Pseudomonadales bacterium]|nr:S1-like domain-containing RNA-binding protein [Pseudomonadales bacterium]